MGERGGQGADSGTGSGELPLVPDGPTVQALFGSIAPRYDLTNSVLSFGVHHLWRRRLRAAWRGLPPTSKVLDLCTGTGDVYGDLIKDLPETVGVDFSLPMLRSGFSDGRSGTALAGDALSLPFQPESFDLVVVAFGMRNLASLEKGFAEIARVLRPGGSLFVLEFGSPRGIFGKLFRLYSSVAMPRIGGLLTGNREAYEYLPESSRRFPCGEAFVGIMEEGGFREVSFSPLTGGIAFFYKGTLRGTDD